MINKLKAGLLLLLLFVFPVNRAHTSAVDAGPVAPSITVAEAVGGIVYTSGGQPRTINVAWNSGSDNPYCEIYFTVNGANQIELDRGHDGVKPITVTAGNSYHLWMVVYPGGGQIRVVTELRLVAEQRTEPALPPPPPASSADARISDRVSGRDHIARLYAINNVRVDPGPRHVMIKFNGPPDKLPYVAIGRGPAITRNNELVFGDNLVGGGVVGSGTVTDAEKAKGQYMFASAFGTSFSEDALEPGRTYYYIITIAAGAGRPPYQQTDKFTMAGEATRVSVVWEKVIVEDDSDDLSTGEISFWFWANFGHTSGKSTSYLNDDADSGRTYDLNQTVIIENAPTLLSLSASGRDRDDHFASTLFVPYEVVPSPLSGPRNHVAADENVAKGEFNLSQYVAGTTVPFRLNSMPGGSLKFAIVGRFTVTRATMSTGTTSSAPNTAPAQEPIRVQGRVRSGAPLAAPLPICEAARVARERNSPAAPGLEAKCRAEQKP